MELEKMSDEEFISEIRATGLYDGAEEELRKRLKKAEVWSYTNITPEQAVKEFKERLINKVMDLNFKEMKTNSEIKRYLTVLINNL